MKPYENRSSFLDEIRTMVRKEIEERFKKEREGKVNKYSTIMQNTNLNTTGIYSATPTFTNQSFFNNKSSYNNMKNKINYGFSTETKTYVNKAPLKSRK